MGKVYLNMLLECTGGNMPHMDCGLYIASDLMKIGLSWLTAFAAVAAYEQYHDTHISSPKKKRDSLKVEIHNPSPMKGTGEYERILTQMNYEQSSRRRLEAQLAVKLRENQHLKDQLQALTEPSPPRHVIPIHDEVVGLQKL